MNCLYPAPQLGMFSTRGDEFIVEPLWNKTTTTISENAAAAADDDDDDDAGLYHVIYRRSAVKAASEDRGDHCGLRGLSRCLIAFMNTLTTPHCDCQCQCQCQSNIYIAPIIEGRI